MKFILLEFVAYSGERGVPYVPNSSHFCTPVLMNITFQVLRLSTFVLTKCSDRNIQLKRFWFEWWKEYTSKISLNLSPWFFPQLYPGHL